MDVKISEAQFAPLDPDIHKELVDKLSDGPPFWKYLGMYPVTLKKGFVRLSLDYKNELKNLAGIAHGGAIFSLADSAAGMTLYGLVQRDEFFTTVEMKINYIKPFTSGTITAEGVVVHKGGQTAVIEVIVYGGGENVIAKALGTYMILKRK